VSTTDVATTESTMTEPAAMAGTKASSMTSAKTPGVATAAMTSAATLRPERDREGESKRRDGEQATHTALL